MISVSHSEAESFTTCERRHYYSYGLKIDSPPEASSIDAARGTYVHLGLAAYFENLTSDPLGAALAYLQRLPDVAMAAEAMVIIQSFHQYRGDEVKLWKVLEVEQETEFILVPDQYKTVVLPDLIAWIPGRGITVVDHKVVYDFMQQKFVDLAGQPIKYFAGRRSAGIKVESAMFNQLRHRKLKNPTANGLFKFHYLNEIGQPIPEARIFNTLKEQVIIAGRIGRLKELSLSEWEQKIVRNANKTVCNYCPFTDICREELNGRDSTLMQKAYYVPRSRRVELEIV